MIIRLIAIDPQPRLGESDVRAYQVPENSREAELLVELFEAAGLEYALIEAKPRKPRK